MAEIRATCATCGDTSLAVDELRLRLCIDSDQGEFRFTCTQCEKVTLTKISGPTFDLLREVGVVCDEWSLPAELFEPRTGPMISDDDVLDFQAILVDDQCFAAAVQSLNS